MESCWGRDVKSVFPPRPAQQSTQPPALKVTNLSWAGRLKNIDFEVRPGEVVGLGGLDGQGQRDLLLALFGALTGVGGSVAVNGKAPACVIVVAVERVYYQCTKAIIRSKLWDPARHVDRKSLPTTGTIIAAVTGGQLGGEEHDRGHHERTMAKLY